MTLNEASKDGKVVRAIPDVWTKDGAKYGLKYGSEGYEFVKRTSLANKLFSVEGGCLTPTMKVHR